MTFLRQQVLDQVFVHDKVDGLALGSLNDMGTPVCNRCLIPVELSLRVHGAFALEFRPVALTSVLVQAAVSAMAGVALAVAAAAETLATMGLFAALTLPRAIPGATA